MTLKVAESLQGRKLMNKEQLENAKADFRARFIELERQKTAENKEVSTNFIKEESKVVDKQRSEELVATAAVEIECVDSSVSKNLSAGAEPSKANNYETEEPVIDKIAFEGTIHEQP